MPSFPALIRITCAAAALHGCRGSPDEFFVAADGSHVSTEGWTHVPERDVNLASRRCNVDRVTDLSYDVFISKYWRRRPVILRSSTLAKLTEDDLREYFAAVGDVPLSLAHPTGRPYVGEHIQSLGKYAAAFTTVAARDAAAANATSDAERNEADDVTFSAYVAQSLSFGTHPELLNDLFTRVSSHMRRRAAAAAAPDAAYSHLCVAHNDGSGAPCACRPQIFVMGSSGYGLPWHWHEQVAGNFQLWGRKRWFMSPAMPPLGFNHRQSILSWLRDVYPRLPDHVWATPGSSAHVGAGSDHMYECTVEAGEIMYVPYAWYHATLNVGHGIAGAFSCYTGVAEPHVYDSLSARIAAYDRKHYEEESAQIRAFRQNMDVPVQPWAYLRPFIMRHSQRLTAGAAAMMARAHNASHAALVDMFGASFDASGQLALRHTWVVRSEAAHEDSRGPAKTQPFSPAIKGILMTMLPFSENGISMSRMATPRYSTVAKHDDTVSSLLHITRLLPDEPEFLFHTGRLLYGDARSHIQSIRAAAARNASATRAPTFLEKRQLAAAKSAPAAPAAANPAMDAYRARTQKKVAAARPATPTPSSTMGSMLVVDAVPSRVALPPGCSEPFTCGDATWPMAAKSVLSHAAAAHADTLPPPFRAIRNAADMQEAVTQLNPLHPDALVYLAYAYETLSRADVLDPGAQDYSRRDPFGHRYLDLALAVAVRTTRVTPYNPHICNLLLSVVLKGAQYGSIVMDDDGFMHAVDTPPAPPAAGVARSDSLRELAHACGQLASRHAMRVASGDARIAGAREHALAASVAYAIEVARGQMGPRSSVGHSAASNKAGTRPSLAAAQASEASTSRPTYLGVDLRGFAIQDAELTEALAHIEMDELFTHPGAPSMLVWGSSNADVHEHHKPVLEAEGELYDLVSAEYRQRKGLPITQSHRSRMKDQTGNVQP